MEKYTLSTRFLRNVQEFPEKIFIKYKKGGKYIDYSWRNIGEMVFKVSSFLLANGIKLGERVAILSQNRVEWFCADFGILCSGGVTVPIYPTSTSGQIEYILKDSNIKILFLENKEQFLKVKDFKFLDKIVIFEGDADNVVIFDQIIQTTDIQKDTLINIINNSSFDDLVTIIYTSGTTGLPKGVYLSHNNFLHNIIRGAEVIEVTSDDIFLSHLPLSHVFERCIGEFIPMYYRSIIAYAEKIDTVGDNLKEIKPTIFVSVPRLYEKILEKIIEKVRVAGSVKKFLFYNAKNTAEKYSEHKIFGKPFTFFDTIKYKFFEKKIYSKLRDVFGGRVKVMISGGAKLPFELGLFYNGVGLNLLEGYGLTETAPVISVNQIGQNIVGSVGKVLKDVDVKIADDGEILVKGPNVTKGYHNKPEENEASFKNGYFLTGDIGKIDDRGFLYITDRKKDLIVTSGGKNIAPQSVENVLKEDSFISEVMLYGEGKKYLSALIVPNFEALKQWSEERNLKFNSNAQMVNDDKIFRLMLHRVEKRCEPLAKYEQIKKFILLDHDFSMEDEEITPTLKLRRKKILEKYKDKLENLYQES